MAIWAKHKTVSVSMRAQSQRWRATLETHGRRCVDLDRANERSPGLF
jgi:hypothetical protein